MSAASQEARRRAVGLASETMAEIIEFWGFKGSMGRIWTLLYLSREPLTADIIAEETRLSAGAVSMAVAELMQWGLVSRDPRSGDRKRHYRAETDLWAILRRIFRERELRLVGSALHRFEEAIGILESAQRQDPQDVEVAFALTRLRRLRDLTKTGYSLVEKLADVGQFSLVPIRDLLDRVMG